MIRNRLKILLAEVDMPINKFAKLISIAKGKPVVATTVSAWIQNHHQPDFPKSVELICDVLKISVKDLYEDDRQSKYILSGGNGGTGGTPSGIITIKKARKV